MRVDTGVYEGGEISMFYDSMIAKLIVHAASRDQAIARMRDALNEFVIRGVASNISFQAALMQHPRFTSGNFNTGLIADQYPKGFNAADLLALDIRRCLHYLGEITGAITNEDQLDYIFGKFCIGK